MRAGGPQAGRDLRTAQHDTPFGQHFRGARGGDPVSPATFQRRSCDGAGHLPGGTRHSRSAYGQAFVLREWAALWNGGQRYSIGERVLLFLYPASKVGLTSPVGGERGRFRLDPKGQVILSAERAKLFTGVSRSNLEGHGCEYL